MCTLTWWHGAASYDVFFNRDELKSRPEGLPPTLETQEGISYLAPTDPVAGGTWLLVNAHGITLSLLNLYEEEISLRAAGTSLRSRGLLLRDLAGVLSVQELGETLNNLSLESYNAFNLVAFQAEPQIVQRWTHRPKSPLEGPLAADRMPISSSSFRPSQVIASRVEAFHEIGVPKPRPRALSEFHHGSDPRAATAYTAFMRRPDAQTWSFSRISVTANEVSYFYEAFPLDHTGQTADTFTRIPRYQGGDP